MADLHGRAFRATAVPAEGWGGPCWVGATRVLASLCGAALATCKERDHFFEALARAEAVQIVAQAHTRPGQLAQALHGSVRTPQVWWGGHVPALAPCARVIWGKYWMIFIDKLESRGPAIPDLSDFSNRLLAKRHVKWSIFQPPTTPLATGKYDFVRRHHPGISPSAPPEATPPVPKNGHVGIPRPEDSTSLEGAIEPLLPDRGQKKIMKRCCVRRYNYSLK